MPSKARESGKILVALLNVLLRFNIVGNSIPGLGDPTVESMHDLKERARDIYYRCCEKTNA